MSIVAALDKVLFFNASSKYSVLRMKTEDSSVPTEARSPYRYHDHLIRFTAVGIELPQTDTVKIEMDGEWKDGKYGLQLQVDHWQEIVPPTLEGVRNYLASGLLKGIGEKTAMALVQEYGSIDALYAQMPDVHAKPAALRKLQEGEEAARRSYWLATIVTDAPLDFDPAEILRRPFRPELYDLFLRLEFQKLIDKYHLRPHQETAERPEVTAAVVPVRTEDQARDLLAQWRQAEAVTVYAMPDLSALSVQWDWQALRAALFAADIP